MEKINKEFYYLIHNSKTNEQDILRFINHTPAYHIPVSILRYYNFAKHDAYLFPEYEIGAYRADYLIIGRNSGGYEFLFVEFERSNGRITLKSGHEGQALRSGTYQVYDWKTEIDSDFASIIGKIIKYSNKETLPDEFIKYDPSRVHFAVVAGLRKDYDNATYRDRRIKLQQQNILLLHYDRFV